MRKLLLSLTILCSSVFGIHLNAQTFYEVAFEENGTEIVGLMESNGDDDCKMRYITAESVQENSVYKGIYRKYCEGKKSADDVNMMVYYPVKEGTDDEIDTDNPAFIWCWEKDDASDMSDSPLYTFNLDDENTYKQVKYFREISISDMDEEYIGQFYGPEEMQYKLLANAIRLMQGNASSSASGAVNSSVTQKPDYESASASLTSAGAALNLIVVANTDVSDIGAACKRDLDNLNSEFQGISRVLGMEYKPYFVQGRDYSKQSVQQLLRDFTPGKNDVVVFVYTGHGWRYDDQEDIYPNIDLCPTSYDKAVDNYLNFHDVANEIFSRGARLSIVLSDCCNAKIGLELSMLKTNTLYSRANNNFDVNKLRSLFLESNGTIMATSSSPGEKSLCDASGGFFTLSFLENLRSNISALSTAPTSWQSIIDGTIATAAQKSKEGKTKASQNGMKLMNVKSTKI